MHSLFVRSRLASDWTMHGDGKMVTILTLPKKQWVLQAIIGMVSLRNTDELVSMTLEDDVTLANLLVHQQYCHSTGCWGIESSGCAPAGVLSARMTMLKSCGVPLYSRVVLKSPMKPLF